MKNLFPIIILAGSLLACRSLQSVTYIEPAQTFALGEGAHGKYKAQVQNIGQDDIEVFVRDSSGETLPLGRIQQAGQGHYEVPPNMQVFFKNTSTTRQGVIQIRIKGDTDLSMGYIREP